MNLLFRFIITLLRAFRGSTLTVTSVVERVFRVWPNDLDLNGHMHHSRYLSIMDLGRAELVVRTGIQSEAFRRGWRPLVGAVMLRYRSGLKLFERARLVSRLACWDDKWFYFEQRFVSVADPDRTIAVAWVKAVLRDNKRNVPPAEVLAAARLPMIGPSPALPDAVRAWSEAEEAAGASAQTLVAEAA